METTSTRSLRAGLKEYLDLASAEPIRIIRRTSDASQSFVLMKEEVYAGLQNEILSLQRRLLGMTQALAGEGRIVEPGEAASGTKSARSRRAKKG